MFLSVKPLKTVAVSLAMDQLTPEDKAVTSQTKNQAPRKLPEINMEAVGALHNIDRVGSSYMIVFRARAGVWQ